MTDTNLSFLRIRKRKLYNITFININSIRCTYLTIVLVMQFFKCKWTRSNTYFRYIIHDKFNVAEIVRMHGYSYDIELNFRNLKISLFLSRLKCIVEIRKRATGIQYRYKETYANT